MKCFHPDCKREASHVTVITNVYFVVCKQHAQGSTGWADQTVRLRKDK